MPTNLLRDKARNVSSTAQKKPAEKRPAGPPRRVLIRIGQVEIRAELLPTPTAERIWLALPFHSTAETWGRAIHFETHVESGRERGARALAEPDDIAFWCEEDRIIVTFGPTPISRKGERRLPRPCNIWAKALDDTTPLQRIVPGEKVSLTAL